MLSLSLLVAVLRLRGSSILFMDTFFSSFVLISVLFCWTSRSCTAFGASVYHDQDVRGFSWSLQINVWIVPKIGPLPFLLYLIVSFQLRALLTSALVEGEVSAGCVMCQSASQHETYVVALGELVRTCKLEMSEDVSEEVQLCLSPASRSIFSSETSEVFYHTTRRYVQEGSNCCILTHSCDSFKFYTIVRRKVN